MSTIVSTKDTNKDVITLSFGKIKKTRVASDAIADDMGDKDNLYNLLKESFLLLDFGDRQLFNNFNLTAPRFYALIHLGNEPGMSLKELSDRMFCDKSNATRIFKGLETEGYAVRQPHESDGRTLRLYLTNKGDTLRSQVLTAHRAYNQKRLDCISNIEQENLMIGLKKLNDFLQADLQKPASMT